MGSADTSEAKRRQMACQRKKGSGLISYTNRIAITPALGFIPLSSKTVILKKKKRMPRLCVERT